MSVVPIAVVAVDSQCYCSMWKKMMQMSSSEFHVQLLLSDVVAVTARCIVGMLLPASCRCRQDRKMPRCDLDVLDNCRGST